MADITTGAALAGASVNAWAASATSMSMALLGVEPHALLYGLVGALLAQFAAERMPAWRARFYVVLSTIAGAAIGTAAVNFSGMQGRGALIVGCMVGGFGAPRLLAALLGRLATRLEADKPEGGK